MRLGERLAKGRTADIYRWNDREVLKLYQPWMPRGAVERERHNTRAARSAGLPVPYAGDIVMLGGRLGLIGVSFSLYLRKRLSWLRWPKCLKGIVSIMAISTLAISASAGDDA